MTDLRLSIVCTSTGRARMSPSQRGPELLLQLPRVTRPAIDAVGIGACARPGGGGGRWRHAPMPGRVLPSSSTRAVEARQAWSVER
jgi:hypothetical protein